MISFAVAVTLLIITPGPGVLSVAGIGSAFGIKKGARYICGLCLGNNLVSALVITGVSPIILSYPFARTVLTILSAAFFLYLAYKIATSGVELTFIKTKTAPGIVAGIIFQLVNPKAYAVNTAIFAGFVVEASNFLSEIATKIVIFNLIWIPIHFVWLYLGVSIVQLRLGPKTQKQTNFGMAFLLLIVVALMILFGSDPSKSVFS